jgi:glucose/arabinose dehydrogenase
VLAALQPTTGQTPPVMPDTQTFGPYTVTKIADGLNLPWSLAFLPNGDMLVTERQGQLRVIRKGVLDPKPVAGVPKIYYEDAFSGLMEVLPHPDFAKNQYVYLSYNKVGPKLPDGVEPMCRRITLGWSPGGVQRPEKDRLTSTLAVARGRFDGTALADVKEIFVANDWKDQSVPATTAARMAWGKDGMLYVTVGGANAPASNGKYRPVQGGVAQDPTRHGGKVLRLRDDGTAPKDNPFVGKKDYLPEIYTMGHRNQLGLAVHPDTGVVWEHENGPADGDEINILKPGANYGWPLTGMGRDYQGDYIGGLHAAHPTLGRKDAWKMYMEGMEQPFVFWTPAVAPSGMLFYTGDKFPEWQGNLFIGELKAHRIERLSFTTFGGVNRRDYLLESMNKRIRDIRQGPDGWIYILTDGNPAQVLRLTR